MSVTDFPEGTIMIEITGIYDGVSVAKLPDGTMVNLWPESETRRHAATEAWIKLQQEQQPRIKT